MKKTVLSIFGMIVFFVLGIYLAFQISPRPSVRVVQKAFEGELITDEVRYKTAIAQGNVESNITYTSDFNENFGTVRTETLI